MVDDSLTPSQVAAELDVTPRTVQRWIREGRLAGTKVGGRVRVSRSSLSSVRQASVRRAPDGTHGSVRAAGTAIRTLLIANRGEIAERVARTATRLGIRAIGVHASDDRPPVGTAEAHGIDSYLDGGELLAVARRAGADAVHPGYGFLAENAAFARAVIEAGLTWVGAPPEAIAAMGDKATARQRAAAQGVPIIPGYDGEAQDDETLRHEAERVGFPLLVKPSAGGGGKGMRVVRDPGDLEEALAAARREAGRAFGDDRLIIERYLERPRHVEIQVLFDGHGNGVHLGERDCSAQRRNQKIVEEAPAPSVSAELRQRMCSAALAVASSVGYASAGTVEMLLTDSGEFFFLEMNTRLQVEHPVTEMITGRDLVADQLRIAAGERLAELGLSVLPRISGHAIEARLYAEDPEAGFLPATGRVAHLEWPAGDGIRIDAGIAEGDTVSDRYDPMLAKLIAHGRDREEALKRLRAALDATTVLGVRTNLRFLRWLMALPTMIEAEMRTDTIAGLDLPSAPTPTEEHWLAAAVALRPAPGSDPWADGWRLNAPASVRLRCGEEERAVELAATATQVATSRASDIVHVAVEGQSIEMTIAPAPSVEEAARHASAAGGDGASVLTAPMPGRVIAVRVAEGASVLAHQPVVIIEAMKMEHAVVSPMDGTVARLEVREGQQVQRGDVLAEVSA
ncbi:MAG: biotin carboxylase N-terminal domain-containing protein [Candidatus Limnocylindria bacterium]